MNKPSKEEVEGTVLRFKQEPKEEPTPTGSQVKWEPKIINEFLDASQFKGNDRINHFLLQAIRQLDTDEIKGLIDGLSGYVPKRNQRRERVRLFERFKKPTNGQIVDLAIIFNDGKLDKEKLTDMVAMADFIIDRLYENGDITIPSNKEKK